MEYKIANVGKVGILKVKKSNAEQLKYRPDLGDVELDLSSESKSNTSGQFNTITGGLMQSCVVDLEPIQDLHGYSKPWVGGSGKNLIPMTVANLKAINTSGTWSGNTYTFQNGAIIDVLTDDDGNVIGFKGSGTTTASTSYNFNLCNFDFVSGTTYKLNGITGGSNSTYRINIAGVSNYSSGDNTVNGDGSTHSIRIQMQASYSPLDFTVTPMLRLATETDATFEPYTNICSISGHTSVEADVVGKNRVYPSIAGRTNAGVTYTTKENSVLLENTATSTSYYHSNASMTFDNSFFVKSGTYTMSIINAVDGIEAVAFNTNTRSTIGNATYDEPFTFTLTEDTYINFNIKVSNGTATNREVSVQIEAGSTATDFEPYKGTDYTTALSATVYGGTLDVVSGVLTVTDGIIASYNGETLPSAWISDRDVYTSGGTPTTGAQVCYKLATPLTIQLTPQQINTLIGENHLDVPLEGQSLDSAVYREMMAWDDVMDVVDTRLPISVIGTDESGRSTASRSYNQGEIFYKDGLCETKTTVASGATWTLNTNYKQTTFAEIIADLRA